MQSDSVLNLHEIEIWKVLGYDFVWTGSGYGRFAAGWYDHLQGGHRIPGRSSSKCVNKSGVCCPRGFQGITKWETLKIQENIRNIIPKFWTAVRKYFWLPAPTVSSEMTNYMTSHILLPSSCVLLEVVAVRTMMTYGRMEVWIHTQAHILNLGTKWRWVVRFMLEPFYPQGKRSSYSLNRSFCAHQSWPNFCGEEELLVHLSEI